MGSAASLVRKGGERPMALAFRAGGKVAKDYLRMFVNRHAIPCSPCARIRKTRQRCYFPAESQVDRRAADVDGRNHSPALGRRDHDWPFCHQSSTQRCKWVAIDADYSDAIEDHLKLQWQRQDGVEPALENSRRGGHLGISWRPRCSPPSAGSTSSTWLCGSGCR